MIQKIFSFLLAFSLLAGIGWAAWKVLDAAANYLSSANPNVVAAIIATAGTVLTSIAAVLLAQHFSRKREILEAHRSQKSEMYSEFIRHLISILRKTKEDENFNVEEDAETLEAMHGFHRQILLWASPSVLKAWLAFRQASVPEEVNVLLRMDSLIQAMRKDLGVSNKQLKPGDIIKILLSDPEELDKTIKT